MILALLAVVQIGSKAFTESVIVAEMAAQLARSAGIEATHRRELGGSRILWDALLGGQIDVYPEYTGTLAQELLPGPGELSDRLAAKGVVMSRSLGFSDSYAVGMKRGTAERLGIHTLQDLARHPELRLGFSNEFMDRKDGWPALRAAYRLPQREVRGMEHDLALRGCQVVPLRDAQLQIPPVVLRGIGSDDLVGDSKAHHLHATGLGAEAIAAERGFDSRDLLDLIDL